MTALPFNLNCGIREKIEMDEGRKKLIKKVSTRKLLASIKMDIQKTIRATAAAPKPKKK